MVVDEYGLCKIYLAGIKSPSISLVVKRQAHFPVDFGVY